MLFDLLYGALGLLGGFLQFLETGDSFWLEPDRHLCSCRDLRPQRIHDRKVLSSKPAADDAPLAQGDVNGVTGGQFGVERIADFEVPVSPNTSCVEPQFLARGSDGQEVCRYPRYRETLPNGRSYEVLDLGTTLQDDTPPFIVPEGHLFMMGDNRDNSMDSRFPAVPGQGIGIVPQGNLVGRASIIMFSTDGSAEWLKPWTWFTAARWNRIGGTF